jgi:hypothetical protein
VTIPPVGGDTIWANLVRTHPETDEKVLSVNFTQHPHIVDWTTAHSTELLQTLKQEATRPEYQVRFTWSPGAIAMWDNRAVHHSGRLWRLPMTELVLEAPHGTLRAGMPLRMVPTRWGAHRGGRHPGTRRPSRYRPRFGRPVS